LNHHNLASKKAFDIEIDNLISLSRKKCFKREGFETNLNEKDQMLMLDILKIGTAGGARPKAIIVQ
jgi:serine/threonine-protein kinase HipA